MICHSLVFDSGGQLLKVSWGSSGEGESIWLSHESGSEMGIFLLSLLSVRLFGLVSSDGPVPLGCFITL